VRPPTTLRWIALALLGLIIAASVALAASQLASQQIGIASESVSAGDSLAPPVTSTAKDRHTKPEQETPAKKHPAPPEASSPTIEPTETVEPEPVESSSGDDGGDEGGGGGGPDD
jgi:hypothetical protein